MLLTETYLKYQWNLVVRSGEVKERRGIVLGHQYNTNHTYFIEQNMCVTYLQIMYKLEIWEIWKYGKYKEQ